MTRLRASALAACLLGVLVVGGGWAGGDLTANPAELLRSIALKSATLSGLLGESNATLQRIHDSLAPIEQLDARMGRLVDETAESRRRTRRIGGGLHRLERGVGRQRGRLGEIVVRLQGLDGQLGQASFETGRALSLTNGMGSDFASVEQELGDIAVAFDRLLAAMDMSVPKVSYFARNRLTKGSPGGLSRRYKAPNVAAGTRVMSVMLPMISALQGGGTLIARKDSATSSSQFLLDLLNQQVPDGTNVRSTIHRYDGRSGLPGSAYFVAHAVAGF
jgi:hypothetical protein